MLRGVNPSDIRELYWGQHQSLRVISEKYDCSQHAVRYFMKKYGIPCGPSGPRSKIKDVEPKEIQKLYYEMKLSIGEIAAKYGCAQSTVLDFMRLHQIPRREVHGLETEKLRKVKRRALIKTAFSSEGKTEQLNVKVRTQLINSWMTQQPTSPS